MNEQTALLILKITIGVIVLMLCILGINLIRRIIDNPEKRYQHTLNQGEGYDINNQKTERLTDNYFGNVADNQMDHLTASPEADIPLMINARVGKTFKGTDIQLLVDTFGLMRSPAGAYELIAENGIDILFTMLSPFKSGNFPLNLADLSQLPAVVLIMQLPQGKDSLEAYETFIALAQEMVDVCDGKLCDLDKKPLGKKELMDYRFAVEEFQNEYQQWLSSHQ